VNAARYWILPIIALPAIVVAAVDKDHSVDETAVVVDILQGSHWGWARKESSVSCENNPHTITVNAEVTEAVFKFRRPLHGADGKKSNRAVYRILARQNNVITMQIVGEKRLDPQGQPVVWDLLLVNERTYTWHRHDWAESAHTPYIQSCD